MQHRAKLIIAFGRMRPWLGAILENNGITLILSLVTAIIGLVIGLVLTFLRRHRIKPSAASRWSKRAPSSPPLTFFDVMYAQTSVKSMTYIVFEPLTIAAAIYSVSISG